MLNCACLCCLLHGLGALAHNACILCGQLNLHVLVSYRCLVGEINFSVLQVKWAARCSGDNC